MIPEKLCPECNKPMKFTTDEGNLLFLCMDCNTHEVERDQGLAQYLVKREDLGLTDDQADLIADCVALYYYEQASTFLPSAKEEQDAIDGLRAKGYLVFTEQQMKQATIDTLKDLKAKGVI